MVAAGNVLNCDPEEVQCRFRSTRARIEGVSRVGEHEENNSGVKTHQGGERGDAAGDGCKQ